MAIPLLIGAAKGLMAGAGKKAAASTAKKFVTGKAKDKVKDKVVDSAKNKVTDKVQERVRPGRKKISSSALVKLPQSVYKTSSSDSQPSDKVSFESLSKQLENINKTTQSLLVVSEAESKSQENVSDDLKSERDKNKRERRESKAERKRKLKPGERLLLGSDGAFDPLGFLTNILLGGAAVGLLNNIDKITNLLSGDNLQNTSKILRSIIIGYGKSLNGIKNILKGFSKNLFSKVGNSIKGGFKSIGGKTVSLFKSLGISIVNKVKNILGIRTPSAPSLSGAAAPTGTGSQFRTPRTVTPSTFELEQARRAVKGPQPTVRPGSLAARTNQLRASLQTGTANVPLPSGAQKALYNAPGKVSSFVSKIFGRKTAQEVASAAPLFKKLSAVKTNIPIVGPMIVAITSALSGEPVSQTLFKSIGAGLGQALGTLIPIPVLGTIIGGLLGEYGGDLLYELTMGGGFDAVKQRIAQDFTSMLKAGEVGLQWIGDVLSKAGNAAMDWVKGIFKKFYKALPKRKIFGKELIDPLIFTNPLSLATTIPKALFDAITKPDEKKEGKKEEEPKRQIEKKEESVEQKIIKSTQAGGMYEGYDPKNLQWNAELDIPEPKIGAPDPTLETPQVSMFSGGLKNIVDTGNFEGIGRGKGTVGMTSGRGMRKNPVTGQMKHHAGVDIGTSGEKGWYVSFAVSGTVTDTGTFSGYGKTVIITSGGKDFLFAHLASIMVKKGEKYEGQIIGEIGNTGAGTGEHLHFEVSPKGTGGYGKDEDPMPYVKYIRIGKLDPNGETQKVDLSPAQPLQGQRSPRDIERRTSYDSQPSGGGVIPVPVPQQQPQSGGGGGATAVVGGSTKDVVNSYYKSQLMGFLYKQG
jgi:murein DD-endopeptidase MepM/ murein hydrolase activator NlpD